MRFAGELPRLLRQDFHEFRKVHRLCKVGVHAGGYSLPDILLVRIRGKSDDGHCYGIVPVQAPYAPGGIVAVHIRHQQIHKNKIVITFAGSLEFFYSLNAVNRIGNDSPGLEAAKLHACL